MRVALVGAYGAGKSTLALALSRVTGWCVAPVSPMADPVRGQALPLQRCTLEQVLALCLRRHGERAAGEALLGDRLVSDGSVLHEWVYLQVLARDPAATTAADAATVAALADHAVAELAQGLGDRYDLVVHVRPQRPLPVGAPIDAGFQQRLDAATRTALHGSDVPVVPGTGTLTARVRTVLDAARAAGHAPPWPAAFPRTDLVRGSGRSDPGRGVVTWA